MGFLAALPVIGSLLDSIGDTADKIFTSDEERLKFKVEMMGISSAVIQAIVQAQGAFDQMRLQLQIAEVQSGDRLIRWTRPLMSWATFGVWFYAFLTNHPMAPEAFIAFSLVAGITSATRGMEKIVGRWHSNGNGNGNSKSV